MKDIITMWRYPKMITLVSLSAALYAALLIPFKSFMLLPGVEIRIATAIVPAMGILFGPAGAWGAAIGNLVADFFGSIGLGAIFGFLANFFFAYVPYKIWYSGKDNLPKTNTLKKVVKYLICSLSSTFAQVSVLAFGLCAVFSYMPYKVLAPILFFTNGIVPFVLGAPLISLFSARLKKWGLLFTEIMKPDDFRTGRMLNTIGIILTFTGSIGAIGVSLYLGIVMNIDTGLTLLGISSPFLLAFLAGLCMIGMQKEDFSGDNE